MNSIAGIFSITNQPELKKSQEENWFKWLLFYKTERFRTYHKLGTKLKETNQTVSITTFSTKKREKKN